jgi:sugar phosphate isomerase/epimerase
MILPHFVLQQLDYIQYIDFYHERIKAFHVKDAEFNPTGKQGTFEDIRAGLTALDATALPGDGQVDLKPFSVN